MIAMEINGIPLHPLVVHAAVVFTPLAALAALAYALRAKWQAYLRWPMAALGATAAASVQLAAMTGDQLKEKLGERGHLIEVHEMWAGRLQAGMWVLGALMVLTAFLAYKGKGHVVLNALLVIGALVVSFLVFKTGDAGAASVWKG